jgi:hypothetical protein
MEALNDNKLFLGIMMIVLNIGSRHLVDEFSPDPKAYQSNLVLRRVALFAVCFVGTRDLVTSLILTAAFIIISTGVSMRNREGMTVQKIVDTGGSSKADFPAYDTSAPLLFK